MKFRIQVVGLVLLIVLGLLCVSACGQSAEDSVKGISPEDLQGYAIVRSQSADLDTKTLITQFKKTVSQQMGTELDLGSDSGEVVPPEILVGQTNRPESVALYDSLRYHDYGYGVVNGKIVIGGCTPETLDLAMQGFLKDLQQATNENTVLAEGEYITRGTYPAQDLKIFGLSAKDLTIVYAPSQKKYAEYLAEAVSDRSGYWVKLLSSKSKLPEEGNLLLLGVDGRDLSAPKDLKSAETSVKVSQSAVLLAGGDYGYDQLCHTLLANVLSGDGDSVEVSTDGVFDEMIRSVSYNLWVGQRTEERISAVVESIRRMNPDTIGVQEATLAWVQDLQTYLPDYGMVGVPRNGTTAEGTYVLYRKDKFNLIDSGTRWLSDTPETPSKYPESVYLRTYTYAVLERKSDGTRFVHVNTHLDYATSDVQCLQTEVLLRKIRSFPYPVVLTGDFNCDSTSAAYKKIVSAGLIDTGKDAPMIKGGETYQNSGKAIDFCFVKGKGMTVLHSRVFTEMINGMHPSDHNAVLVDFLLQNDS